MCANLLGSTRHRSQYVLPLATEKLPIDAMIRYVLLIAPLGCEHELQYVDERINGEALKPDGQVLSNVWQTVTPVILDGYSKKSKSDQPQAIARQTVKLLCKTLMRAGIETPCEFTWQSIPYLKNCLSAHNYDRNGRPTGYHRAAHLWHFSTVHVRLTFTHPVPGPITIGASRHCGFGLFARQFAIGG